METDSKIFLKEKMEDGLFVEMELEPNQLKVAYDSKGRASKFIVEFSSGSKFVGEFKDSLMHGNEYDLTMEVNT